MVNGTPVYEIAPYEHSRDCIIHANGGWTQMHSWPELRGVEIDEGELIKIPSALREGLVQILRQDPRPAYTRKGHKRREFWITLGNCIIWFVVDSDILHVKRVDVLSPEMIESLEQTGSF